MSVEKLFPNVAKYIQTIKATEFGAPIIDRIVKGKREIKKGEPKPGRKIFACFLQQAESRIWITNILQDATELGINCITIHDSVVCTEDDKDKMNDIIDAAYSRMVCSNPNIKMDKVATINYSNTIDDINLDFNFTPAPFHYTAEELIENQKIFLAYRKNIIETKSSGV